MKSPKIHNQGILGALHLSLCVLKKVSFPPPLGGGTPIWNRWGCSLEILNLTPKGEKKKNFCFSSRNSVFLPGTLNETLAA